MLEPHKKKSSRRLSAFFFPSSHDDRPSTAPAPLEVQSRDRLSSAPHITAPSYPPPPPPGYGSAQSPTIAPIAPVESAPALLELPTVSGVGSRPGSRGTISMTSPLSSRPNSRSNSRPSTPTSDGGSGGVSRLAPEHIKRKLKRKSRLFGSKSGSDEGLNGSRHSPPAWVIGHQGKVPYNLHPLLHGERLSELWDEEGDTYIYLFPRTSGKGASFRIDSSAFSASRFMTRLVYGRLYSDTTVGLNRGDIPGRGTGSPDNIVSSRTTSPEPPYAEDASEASKGSRALSDLTEDSHQEQHLYLPIKLSTDAGFVAAGGAEPDLNSDDLETLVAHRNFIAFLVGQSLVATEKHPTVFDIFLRIADILDHYQFSNVDGSTYGEVAASSFESYVEELGLADVRSSREKTIEAIVLGERMRCASLYTEGFVHAAGKLADIKDLNHPKMSLVSPKTIKRLERASLDLNIRIQTIDEKLKDFKFETLFSGLMNSATSDEAKVIRFKTWKDSFQAMASHVLSYYKHEYGSWLPKAKSKKNNLTTSGLNRLVLKDLYHDFTALYDLLVDRTNLTTRTSDGVMVEDERDDIDSVITRALRRVMSEYDRSAPPVLPPIPFDLPLFPSLKTTRPNFPTGDPKQDVKARAKKIKDDEMRKILEGSHNADAEFQTPFLDEFRRFEFKQAHGKTMNELSEQRSGQWMFMYAVLQSLPLLVVDVPGLRYTEGVEYFLCEAPRKGLPWIRVESGQQRNWFGVAGGSHVVNLPTDVVTFGVEGTYRRSHCWEMANKWSQNDTLMRAAVAESLESSLPPPPGFHMDGSGGSKRSSVVEIGLEALPVPGNVASAPQGRSVSHYDPNKTFDSILDAIDGDKKSKKKK